LEAAVPQAVIACAEIIGVPQPSEDKIQEALDAVGAHTVSSNSKHVKENRSKGKPQARYYALLDDQAVLDISSNWRNA
jgi:tRNA ligase